MNVQEKLSEVANKTVESYNSAKTKGAEEEWSTFWDAFQRMGGRTNYDYAFYPSGWNDNNFKPKYNIIPTSGTHMFRGCKATNIKQYFEDHGLILDLSKIPTLAYCFRDCASKYLPTINTTSANSLEGIFYNSKIISIDKLVLRQNGSQNSFSNAFSWCNNLSYMPIEGTIGKSISFSYCENSKTFTLPTGLVDPNKNHHYTTIVTNYEDGVDQIAVKGLLYDPTITSIIAALKDLTGTDEKYTLTLGEVNKAKLTNEDIITITQTKGWTLA